MRWTVPEILWPCQQPLCIWLWVCFGACLELLQSGHLILIGVCGVNRICYDDTDVKFLSLKMTEGWLVQCSVCFYFIYQNRSSFAVRAINSLILLAKWTIKRLKKPVSPTKRQTSWTFLGAANSKIARTFALPGCRVPLRISKPKNSIDVAPRIHFFCL